MQREHENPTVPLEQLIPQLHELEKDLKKMMLVKYHDGKVVTIHHDPEEQLWSVNIKRGIANAFHVDVLGKDLKTNDDTFFQKEEVSLFNPLSVPSRDLQSHHKYNNHWLC